MENLLMSFCETELPLSHPNLQSSRSTGPEPPEYQTFIATIKLRSETTVGVQRGQKTLNPANRNFLKSLYALWQLHVVSVCGHHVVITEVSLKVCLKVYPPSSWSTSAAVQIAWSLSRNEAPPTWECGFQLDKELHAMFSGIRCSADVAFLAG